MSPRSHINNFQFVVILLKKFSFIARNQCEKYNGIGRYVNQQGKYMRKIFAMCAVLLFVQTAIAQTTCQTIGGQQFCSDSNGNTSNTTRIGDQSFTRYSNGGTATSTQYGDSRYTRHSDGTTANTTRIGDTQYTTRSDGLGLHPNQSGIRRISGTEKAIRLRAKPSVAKDSAIRRASHRLLT
jgi:hypothetical protein